MWECPYVNDKRHGISKYYSESGELIKEIEYVNGEEHDIIKDYYTSLVEKTP